MKHDWFSFLRQVNGTQQDNNDSKVTPASKAAEVVPDSDDSDDAKETCQGAAQITDTSEAGNEMEDICVVAATGGCNTLQEEWLPLLQNEDSNSILPWPALNEPSTISQVGSNAVGGLSHEDWEEKEEGAIYR